MSQNFNVYPWYDDFDPSKNFHRVLFKPGVAVQARELTQSQTILQNQISNFADSIFSQNTPVSGGKVTVNTGCHYLKLAAQYDNVNIVASDFLNKTIISSDGTIVAKVITTVEATTIDPPTLIITYLSGNHFTDNTNIFDADNLNTAATTYGVTGGTTCTGVSSAASVTDGIFYIVNGYSQSSTQNSDGTHTKYSIGNFVSVLPHTIVLEKYDNTPTYRIGLTINETVVDYIDDASLLDPAVGASNYQAPGADRYQITLSLTTKPLDIGNDQNFIELVRIVDGSIQKQVDSTVYSSIDDYFAKRTKETNGDYIVNDFKITPTANSINPDTYTLSVGPGIAYVNGYRVENQSTVKIESNRARTTANVNNSINNLDFGNYLYVTDIKGQGGKFFDATTACKVDFHCVADASNNIISTNNTTYSATQIGSAYLRGFTYVPSAGESGANTFVYKAHVFDVSSNVLSGTVSTATSNTITFTSSGGKFSGISNAYVGVTLTIDSGPGAGDTTTIVSYNGTTKTANVSPAFTVTPTSSSTFSLRFAVKDIESVVRTASNLALNAQASISVLGKSNLAASGDTKLFDTNSNKLIYPLGASFISGVSDTSYTTVQEFRSEYFGTASPSGCKKVLQLSNYSQDGSFQFISSGAVEDASSIKENYIVVNNSTGEVIDFTAQDRSVAVTANSVTFTALDLGAFTGTIYAKMAVTNASDTNFTLKTKTLVAANTTTASSTGPDGIVDGTYIDLSKGQIWIPNNVKSYGTKQTLYVSDIKRIVKIIDTLGQTPTADMYTNGLDVTSRYDFNDGQTDNYYGHGYISLKPGRSTPSTLWILFDHYEHSPADGYFSAESYTNIGIADRPTYTSGSGTTYQLKDCLDFRPAVENAQTDFVFKYKTAPTAYNTSGLFLPASDTQFTADYTYYLARKDVLYIGKDKFIGIVEGNPAINPILPNPPENSLVLANITLDPYTAYLPGDNSGHTSSVGVSPVLHKRWAFSDITNLQTRVNNLEYYASLNLLEQNAASLQIRDENNLNRFKNGILVDDFSTFSVGDTYNPEFSASINTRSQYMAPAILVKNYVLQNQHLLLNNNLSANTITGLNYYPIKNGKSGLYMLNYTEQELVRQPLASRTINVNPGGIGSPVGIINLTPPMDNWVDNTAQPDTLFVDPNLKTYQASDQINLLEGDPTLGVSDWKSIPGTKVSVDDGTYTTVTEQRSNQYTYGYWSQTYNQVGDYLTNISILPYIRSQHLTFQASGMLFNTTVNAFFDGKRVSRLVRKPNIVELTGVSGSFTIGDTIGYLSGTSTFVKTGEVIDIYKYANGNIRLYVIGDTATTTYTTNTTVINGKFNTTGQYQSYTASGTYSSSTHYSGAVSSSHTNTSSVTLSGKAASTDIYTGLEFWIVSGSELGLTSIPNGLKATVTAYNPTSKVVTLDRNISYTTGDIYSIGPIQTNEAGNVSGVFFLPGNYFHTGQRTFRLDNRVVQQTQTEFVYSTGSETTYAEAIFYAQGLATSSQALLVTPSVSTAKNTETTVQTKNYQISRTENPRAQSGGGGGCCVIATALTNHGEWEGSQKAGLIEWCEAKLHDKWWGETIRRGYQVIGSKVAVPLLNNSTVMRKYANWQFTNATNMLRGKSFNPLSVPTGLVWITAMVVTGAVVSKKFATKCWTSLYKN